MKEIIGQKNSAKIFTDNVDELSIFQIQILCNYNQTLKIKMSDT